MSQIDFERLFKLRLVVGRYGEMDNAKWWNTNKILGSMGKTVFKRGFPRTHLFTQAKVVFEVARARSKEIFDPPACMTLWNLPVEIEDLFDSKWSEWAEKSNDWQEFFIKLESIKSNENLLDVFHSLGLVGNDALEQARKLKRAADNRAVPLPGVNSPSDETFTLLALGHFRGETGNLAVPYSRLDT